MMKERSNKYLVAAILLAVTFHGTAIFFTLENTYDALIHLFFADHYAGSWFEPWENRWYTGFSVMSYPPLVHQVIALFSFVGGLKFGLFSVAILGIVLFVSGVYRFAFLLTNNKKSAGYASLIAVFSSSFVETLHVFGQLPSIIGISVLMHSLPSIYYYIRSGRLFYLFSALSLIAVTVCSHHVTPIFGMVFFIFPLLGMAVMDAAREKTKSIQEVTFTLFIKELWIHLRRIITFGGGALILIVVCILPYWLNSKQNPITQIPIPHGSRDNFLEVTSSGLVFFVIPWGVILFLFPYLYHRYFSKRYLFFGLSFLLLSILGTGGTTPLAKFILGDAAFNILTLDRFTLWASIMALPMLGEFACRFAEGDVRDFLQKRHGVFLHRLTGVFLVSVFLFFSVMTIHLSSFRPMEPPKIKMLPILNFLNQDQHAEWRFLTLGFGDQMAWLSAQTKAMTVDGNYHSARRLPELTSHAVERLESSKFRGVEGIGSLQQFLTVPERYNLKFIFSNDKFYDPLLYFCGWQRLRQLENGIMVWEKLNIPPLAQIQPKQDVSKVLKIMWGLIPVLTILVAFMINIQYLWYRKLERRQKVVQQALLIDSYPPYTKRLLIIGRIWIVSLLLLIIYASLLFYFDNSYQRTPENAVRSYYDALDFKQYELAHSYIDNKKGVSLDQFLLDISVSDGLLSSYAKLNTIQVNQISGDEHYAKLKVVAEFITPLEIVPQTVFIETIKRGDKWFLIPEKIEESLPPDQFKSDNITVFYNHGRRRVTTQQTRHEDVLKQPVLEILSATLTREGSEYAIIGELQNIDDVPADVSVKGNLYDADNNLMASYNAMYFIKHKLMPREITSFKINFEGVAWSKNRDQQPKVFNPNEFTAILLESVPATFDVQCAGNVANKDLYKEVSVSELNTSPTKIKGLLFNGGTEEVTIPQLLISYYNDKRELVDVDCFFVPESIRQQRKRPFEAPLKQQKEVSILQSSLENCYVNGLPNEQISRKVLPVRTVNYNEMQLIPVKGLGFDYIKIELNNYIGNPN